MGRDGPFSRGKGTSFRPLTTGGSIAHSSNRMAFFCVVPISPFYNSFPLTVPSLLGECNLVKLSIPHLSLIELAIGLGYCISLPVLIPL